MSLSENEIALMDAVKAVADVLIAMNEKTASALEMAFAHQRDGKIATKQPDAAALFELLRRFAADPERAAFRKQVRELLSATPQGRA